MLLLSFYPDIIIQNICSDINYKSANDEVKELSVEEKQTGLKE